jgi:hypothetical protein
MGEDAMNELTAAGMEGQLVPAGFAEKAMASLMQLHGELMDEKERRVDLYRRLMEREQALAELKMYVKLLEEKVAPPPAPVAAPPPAEMARQRQPAATPPPPPRAPRTPPRVEVSATVRPPVPPRIGSRPTSEGWKAW